MRQSGPPRRPREPAVTHDPALGELLARIAGRRARARQRMRHAGLVPPLDGRPRPAPEPAADKAVATPAIAAGATDAAESLASRPGAAGAAPGTVLTVARLGTNLLRFALARPAGFAYRPGQSVKLELGGLRRRYTIVSAPHEPALEFFVELVPGGRMSERLAALRPKQQVGIGGGPKTGIALDAQARRHLMLATVTGVNPFVSLLRDALHQGRRDLNAILVHGASFADEFGYREELEALAAARPDLLAYSPTVSRPGEARNAGWTGATGRADLRIDDTVARFRLRPADTAVYACGHPGMVDTAQRRMTERGYAVRTERYSGTGAGGR